MLHIAAAELSQFSLCTMDSLLPKAHGFCGLLLNGTECPKQGWPQNQIGAVLWELVSVTHAPPESCF